MKQRNIILIGLLLNMIISGGCAMANIQTTQPIQQASPTVSSRNNSPTTTATQTFTHIPTLISTHAYTPTLTPTIPIPFSPTLPAGEARLRLLGLLANNGDCRLPCIWGITPGNSLYSDGQRILIPLVGSTSQYSNFISGLGGIDINFHEGELIISTSTHFITYPDTDVISGVRLIAGVIKTVPDPDNPDQTFSAFVFDSTIFGSKLAFYMLPHILSEYGRPSSVLLSTDLGPNEFGDMGLFYLILMYPDQGFIVHYTTGARMSGSDVLGCMANAHITVDAYPSGHGDTFYGLLPEGYSDVALVSYKPLEEVTSMSLDQFYQTFNKPTDQCIVTASANWPKFER